LVVTGSLLLVAASGWWWFDVREAARRERSSPPSSDTVLDGAIPKPSPAPQGFVGSAVCRACHGSIADAYLSHPMARSMRDVRDSASPEDYSTATSFSPAPSREYRVERSTEGVLHHEIARDPEGVIYDQAVPVHYAIGSGQRGCSYAIDREGWLFMSPISWYTQGRRWDLSPMYAVDRHPRFERRVTSRCVACHAGRVAPSATGGDRFDSPPFAELSIGCERCHGPGADHVLRHRSTQSGSGPDPIVNPSRLDPARRDSVCHQCHLQGADAVLRLGRTDFDFRPGMHVGEIWSVFLDASEMRSDGTTVAVSQVEQMLSSRCALDSGGRLGCISCHDPHRVPNESQRVEFYRTRCLTCHAAADCREAEATRSDADGDSCIACHMPRLAATDVPHTSQTDHRIVRKPGTKSARASTGRSLDWQLFEPDEAGLTKIEEQRARGILLARQAERSQSPVTAAAAIEKLRSMQGSARDDVELLDALAIAEFITGDRIAAIRHWRDILRVDRSNGTALQSLGLASFQTGDLSAAERYLSELTHTNPWSAGHISNLAQVHAAQRRWDQAISAAIRGLELDPSRPAAYDWLAGAFEQSDQHRKARKYRELARRLRAIEPPLKSRPK
jgi:hypothetical protein